MSDADVVRNQVVAARILAQWTKMLPALPKKRQFDKGFREVRKGEADLSARFAFWPKLASE